MKRFNLLHLETLCTIARAGTFHAAARHLNTTQPAVSARIRELEGVLGAALFNRRGRRMELTPRGRELVTQVQPLLLQFEDLLVSHGDPGAAGGVVRMGVGEIAALTWFPAFMARLKATMPRVSCEVVIDLTMGMRQRLENGDIDLAIMAGPVTARQMRHADLGPIHLHWMTGGADRTLPASQGLAALLEHKPVWALARPSAMYEMTVAELEQSGVRLNHINTCTQIQALIELVAAGAGVALLPDVMIGPYLRDKRLRPALRGTTPRSLDFVIAWNAHEEQAVIRSIVELARESSTFAGKRAGIA